MDRSSTKLSAVVLICLMGAPFLFWASAKTPADRRDKTAGEPTSPRRRYTKFPHAEKAHKLDCGTCHKFPSPNWNKVRDEKIAFPDITDYPKHDSCVRCHQQQFFRGRPPAVCTICHTKPGPRNSTRYPYPNPREMFDKSPKANGHESDFVVGFPHDKHVDIVSSNSPEGVRFVNAAYPGRAAEESCAVCHQTMAPQDKSDDEFYTKPPPKWGDAFWLKKGTFKSAPIGHTVCFTCHSADTGMMPTGDQCASCHHLKPPQPAADFDAVGAKTMAVSDKVMLDAWKNRHSAGTFRHEWFSHAELTCGTCHSIATMNTADPSTLRVNVSACATCHVTATSDDGGALNYEVDSRSKDPKFQCAKCHVTFGKLQIPESHTTALAAAAGK